jgi:hypothetical protein
MLSKQIMWPSNPLLRHQMMLQIESGWIHPST